MNRRQAVASIAAATVGAVGLMGAFGGQNPRSWPEHAAPVAEASHANLLSNPSFETNTAGWIGQSATLSRVSESAPPGGGTWVVKATCTCVGAQSWTLNDSPNTVANPQQGQVYTASAWVRAAAPSTVGKLLYLKLVELGGATGNGTSQTTITLTDSWQQITLTRTVAQADRTSLDTYLIAAGSTPGDSFYADLLSLTRAGDDPTPTLEPTWTSTPSPTATATLLPTNSPTPLPSSTPTFETPTPSPTPTLTATATSTPTASSVESPSGESMPLSAPAGWTRVFSEDFVEDIALGQWTGCTSNGSGCSGLQGTSYYSRWWAYPTGWIDSSKHGTYDPARVLSVHDGVLDKWLRTVDGKPRVAAILPKHQPHTNLRITYRYRVPQVIPRYKLAYLLWPDSGVWPRDGEADCPEEHFNAVSVIWCFMHRQGATSGGDQDVLQTTIPAVGAWHTVTMEWRTGVSTKVFIDGALLATWTNRVPNTPMHIVAQAETEISSNIPDPATEGHILWDWITVDTLN